MFALICSPGVCTLVMPRLTLSCWWSSFMTHHQSPWCTGMSAHTRLTLSRFAVHSSRFTVRGLSGHHASQSGQFSITQLGNDNQMLHRPPRRCLLQNAAWYSFRAQVDREPDPSAASAGTAARQQRAVSAAGVLIVEIINNQTSNMYCRIFEFSLSLYVGVKKVVGCRFMSSGGVVAVLRVGFSCGHRWRFRCCCR